MAWTLDEIVAATAGRLQYQGTSAKRFGEIVTDSSQVKEGSTFVALKGQRLDGHRFINDAVNRGAACLVVHRSVRRSDCTGTVVIRVADTLRALGDLAHYRRQKYAPKVLAITGSNGKTTTKEMLFAIFQEASLNGTRLRGKVLKTAGNFNNLIGLPLTLLRLSKKHRVAVLELGTNRPGEIKRLAEIAAPDLGTITSVAAAHLEGLSSLAGVAKEKGALFQSIDGSGTITVNLQDPWVVRLASKFRGKKITYGAGGYVRAESDVRLSADESRFTLRVGAQRCRIRLRFVGQHNISNALGAAAMAHGLGVGLSAIQRGLQKVKPYEMRMEVQRWRGVGFINDAYNANPASMQAAVSTLAGMPASGDRVAVLGDMFELGKQSQRQHLRFGAQVASAGIDRVYLLGEHAVDVQRGALHAGMPAQRIIIGRNHAEISRLLRRHLKKGDWLLVKGSRGMKMETIVRQLKGEARGE